MSAVERPSSVVGAEVASFDQLHALYVLSDVLARAGEAHEIYEAALDALAKTVTPDRSSVLVFDEHDVMRFRAHRGLSDAYRAAVEGHSPWRVDETAPLPITVEDVREDRSMAGLLPVILAEGIVALAFVPVVYGGRLLGKFMLYFDRPHHFTRPEMLLAETVARHVAFAVARTREGETLRRALEARQEFLSIASHELKTPVAALSLQLEGLLRLMHRGPVDPSVSLERLERTRGQVAKIVTLIDKLLDFSRIDAGRLQIDDESVDVAALVRDSAARFVDSALRAGSTLEIDVQGELVTRSDAQRLDQIVTNLVSNAVKYGDGKPILVRAESVGDAIRITVRDRGIGIAPAAQERVFARFERAVEARRYAGFGLGLFISRQLAQALGCTLSLESALGEGSTFTLVVPKMA